jgi:hypothetical protein
MARPARYSPGIHEIHWVGRARSFIAAISVPSRRSSEISVGLDPNTTIAGARALGDDFYYVDDQHRFLDLARRHSPTFSPVPSTPIT